MPMLSFLRAVAFLVLFGISGCLRAMCVSHWPGITAVLQSTQTSILYSGKCRNRLDSSSDGFIVMLAVNIILEMILKSSDEKFYQFNIPLFNGLNLTLSKPFIFRP
jgi:hypothetical protein